MTFRFLTAGESHGKALTAIVEGIPAGLALSEDYIARDLRRRQGGRGRGGRQQIESDRAEIVSGVRHGLTLGSPITLVVANRDWENWREVMAVEAPDAPVEPVTRLRPGHADLAGAMKYGQADVRNILERASARETAARVAAGAVTRRFLEVFGVAVHSHTVAIGGVEAKSGRRARLAGGRRSAAALRRRGCRAAHAGRHRCRAHGRRQPGRRDGGAGDGRADWPGEPRPVGQAPERPAGPGGDEHPFGEGRGDGRRLRPGANARVRVAGRYPARRRVGRATVAARIATTPAAWRAA